MEIFITSSDRLGEGPVWDSRRGELLWVDIEKFQLYCYSFYSGGKSVFKFNSYLSAVVPVTGGDNYLLALQGGLHLWNRGTNELQLIADPEKDIPGNRFNDGKCDPWGRFWIGSMDCRALEGKGSLYRLDQNLKVKKMLSRVSVSNGLAWDDKQNMMYYIDSLTFRVLSFDFDAISGEMQHPKTAVEVPSIHGSPDGMCIDEKGMLWIAHWGGANVSRWNPRTGALIGKIDVPALNVTSCCFGGTGLDTLFITSAKSGLSTDHLQRYPFSGSVFAIKPGVKGAPSFSFKLNH